jgi:hypothetical protein
MLTSQSEAGEPSIRALEFVQLQSAQGRIGGVHHQASSQGQGCATNLKRADSRCEDRATQYRPTRHLPEWRFTSHLLRAAPWPPLRLACDAQT